MKAVATKQTSHLFFTERLQVIHIAEIQQIKSISAILKYIRFAHCDIQLGAGKQLEFCRDVRVVW